MSVNLLFFLIIKIEKRAQDIIIIIILLSFCLGFSRRTRETRFLDEANSSGLILMRRRSVFIEKQPYGASPLKSWLFAVIVSAVTSRLPCVVQVIRHIVALRLHVGAHLIKRRGGDEMARSVYLPRDWGPRRAHGVVSGRTGGGTGVVGDLAALVAVDDHASHEVRVVVVLVVDDGENLRLHTNVEVERSTADNSCKRRTIDIAENPVVERSLVLVRRTTRADGLVCGQWTS